MEIGQTDIERAEAVFVTRREVPTPLVSRAFVLGLEGGDAHRTAQAAVVVGEGLIAEAGHREEAEFAPLAGEVEIDHRLAEIIFGVEVFDQVDLVDDVDEVVRLCPPPEHGMRTDQHVPAVAAIAVIRFAQIGVRAPRVINVVAGEWRHLNLLTAVVPGVGRIDLAEQ